MNTPWKYEDTELAEVKDYLGGFAVSNGAIYDD